MIGVTGASGYVGGRILARVRASEMDAVAFVRRPEGSAPGARRYALAEPLEESLLDEVEVVVHAAWDLSERGDRLFAVNVAGSLPLLEAVAARGGRVLLISSLAAFAGARSEYGRAKYELERAVLQRGGVVVRPGLVFGVDAGGLFGAMVRTVSRRGPIPLVGDSERLFVTHDERLGELVTGLLRGGVEAAGPLFAAHERPTTLRAIAEAIALARGQHRRVIPVPPGPVFAALRGAETIGLSLPYRSDSVRSLMNPIPLDQVAALERSPVRFPPLRPDLWAR